MFSAGLHRLGARAAQPGPYDLQRHDVPPVSRRHRTGGAAGNQSAKKSQQIYDKFVDKFYRLLTDKENCYKSIVPIYFNNNRIILRKSLFNQYTETNNIEFLGYYIIGQPNGSPIKLYNVFVTNKYIYFVYNNGDIYYDFLENLATCIQINKKIGIIDPEVKFYWHGDYSFFVTETNIHYHNIYFNDIIKINGNF